MRFLLLVLCLVASFNCNFVDVASCLLKNKKLVSIVSEGINLVKEKKFIELFEFALSNLNEVKTITLTCLNDEPNLQLIDTVIPTGPIIPAKFVYHIICSVCKGKKWPCKNICHK